MADDVLRTSLLYESGEDAMDFHQQLDKTLTDLRVTHNTVVKVEDILQDLEMEISIVHKCVVAPSHPLASSWWWLPDRGRPQDGLRGGQEVRGARQGFHQASP
jgi:hypothetical protein